MKYLAKLFISDTLLKETVHESDSILDALTIDFLNHKLVFKKEMVSEEKEGVMTEVKYVAIGLLEPEVTVAQSADAHCKYTMGVFNLSSKTAFSSEEVSKIIEYVYSEAYKHGFKHGKEGR